MRHYEIVVLMRAGERDRNKIAAERYQKIVSDSGGATHRFEDWGNRVLAYPLQRQTRGHYFLFNVECGQEALDQLKENLRFSESVVRFLIIRCSAAISDMSPIAKEMAAKEAEEAEKAEDEDAKDADADAVAASADDSGKASDETDEEQRENKDDATK